MSIIYFNKILISDIYSAKKGILWLLVSLYCYIILFIIIIIFFQSLYPLFSKLNFKNFLFFHFFINFEFHGFSVHEFSYNIFQGWEGRKLLSLRFEILDLISFIFEYSNSKYMYEEHTRFFILHVKYFYSNLIVVLTYNL